VSDRRTPDAKLIEAVRILSRTINTEDGVIPACLAEVATRLAELVEDRRWVPVGERFPEKYQTVLVALTPDNKGRVEVCEAVHWKGSDFETDKGNYECSHWMPLPPGPEGDGNG
jgi:hypothetical protein